LPVATMLREGK